MTETEQIAAIYEAYPRKIGKRAALKAIVNAVKRMTAGDGSRKDDPTGPREMRRLLWSKAREYANSPAGRQPTDRAQDFRPHPATWFNGDRFYDDPGEWQKPNGSRNGKHTTADSETIARANARIAELGRNHLRAR